MARNISRAEKAAALLQAQAAGLSDMVTRRLTSRQRPWVHEGDTYRMSWKDISAYTFGEIEPEIRAQLAEVNIGNVSFQRNVDGFALRIIVPESEFNKRALQPDASHPTRIHQQTARGGR
jgi:hypothetical protein